jgi:hypothetical protein
LAFASALFLRDEPLICVERLRADDGPSVDEQRRRRFDSMPSPFFLIRRDLTAMGALFEAPEELRLIETSVSRMSPEAVSIERLLVLEQAIVKLPEASLIRSASRRLRGSVGPVMNRQRKVFPD